MNGRSPRSVARRYLTRLASAAGAAVLVGLVVYAGPARLVHQLPTLGPLLPVLLVLTGIRYFMQAAGWRLAIAQSDRPGSAACFNAGVVGEALGYVAWGSLGVYEAASAFLADALALGGSAGPPAIPCTRHRGGPERHRRNRRLSPGRASMPSFDERLSHVEIKAIANYLSRRT